MLKLLRSTLALFAAPLVSLLAPFGMTASASSAPAYPTSDHFDGERFFNPGIEVEKGFLDLLKWWSEGGRAEWPTWVENTAKPELPMTIAAGEAYFTFINHATYLIQTRGLTALIDPVFSERVSPFTFAGPKRVRPPGIELENLPKIDLVLVSHNHYDHLDIASLKRLNERFQPTFILPLGHKELLSKAGITNVIELDWWQTHAFTGESVKTAEPVGALMGGSINSSTASRITLVPAQHWSKRWLFDRNLALWGGFWLEVDGLKIYYSGDTGYGPHFKTIAEKLGKPDVSLLPIGAYEPRWFMQPMHMNPSDAVQAFLDLKSHFAIGLHFGTFQLTNEAIDAPVLDLGKALAERQVAPSLFVAPLNGVTSKYSKTQESVPVHPRKAAGLE
jgi:L-ascorbate metabolism protein UlaG (beta-lactamase superfamily)